MGLKVGRVLLKFVDESQTTQSHSAGLNSKAQRKLLPHTGAKTYLFACLEWSLLITSRLSARSYVGKHCHSQSSESFGFTSGPGATLFQPAISGHPLCQ